MYLLNQEVARAVVTERLIEAEHRRVGTTQRLDRRLYQRLRFRSPFTLEPRTEVRPAVAVV